MERKDDSVSDCVVSRSSKLNLESIKAAYNDRPNAYSDRNTSHYRGLQNRMSPTNSQVIFSNAPIPLQRRNVVDDALLAEAAEQLERIPYGQEDFRNLASKGGEFSEQPKVRRDTFQYDVISLFLDSIPHVDGRLSEA